MCFCLAVASHGTCALQAGAYARLGPILHLLYSAAYQSLSATTVSSQPPIWSLEGTRFIVLGCCSPSESNRSVPVESLDPAVD